MKNLLQVSEYKDFLFEIKNRVPLAQLNAAVHVNQELLMFYWDLGAAIVEKQRNTAWGDGFLRQLSSDLFGEFPNIKGFSKRNLELVRQWHLFWSSPTGKSQDSRFAKQAVSQITRIPWGHNLVIIAKCKQHDEALFYVHATLTHGWSRSVLTHQIESGLWEREGKALSNFETALSSPQSDLARQTLKDPYVFDFLTLTRDHNERQLEQGLLQHITKSLLELGAGFAYMGRQVPLQVGQREFFLDLLFYHPGHKSYAK